jgi:hypothetical protein
VPLVYLPALAAETGEDRTLESTDSGVVGGTSRELTKRWGFSLFANRSSANFLHHIRTRDLLT